MFTGLVEELGRIEGLETRADGVTLTVHSPTVVSDATVGASIAVNGCCLTVVGVDGDTWQTEAVPETMARTSLGDLNVGSSVNLERAMAAGGRLGGHIVQGHVDGTTDIVSITALDDGSWRYRFGLPDPLSAYVVEKGSITVDGISLTVAAVDHSAKEPWFEIAVIPHTAEVTNLGSRTPGARVNLEVDVLAKYVEQQVAAALQHHLASLTSNNPSLSTTDATGANA